MKCFRLIQFNVLPGKGVSVAARTRRGGCSKCDCKTSCQLAVLLNQQTDRARERPLAWRIVEALLWQRNWNCQRHTHTHTNSHTYTLTHTHTHRMQHWARENRKKELSKIFALKLISFSCTFPQATFSTCYLIFISDTATEIRSHQLIPAHTHTDTRVQIGQLKQWSAFVHYSYVPLAAHFSIINCKRLSKYWYDQNLIIEIRPVIVWKSETAIFALIAHNFLGAWNEGVGIFNYFCKTFNLIFKLHVP